MGLILHLHNFVIQMPVTANKHWASPGVEGEEGEEVRLQPVKLLYGTSLPVHPTDGQGVSICTINFDS